jgi:trk system potassium uptake protein TrkH
MNGCPSALNLARACLLLFALAMAGALAQELPSHGEVRDTLQEIVEEDTILDVFVFVGLFVILFALSTILLYLDSFRTPAVSLSGLEAMSVAIATLGNVGPGYGVVGPMDSFLPFSDAAKLYMIFLMWIGRLEVLSVLVILSPSFWQR